MHVSVYLLAYADRKRVMSLSSLRSVEGMLRLSCGGVWRWWCVSFDAGPTCHVLLRCRLVSCRAPQAQAPAMWCCCRLNQKDP